MPSIIISSTLPPVSSSCPLPSPFPLSSPPLLPLPYPSPSPLLVPSPSPQLCMPDGFRFKKNLPDPSLKTHHTFCITKEDGSRLYGSVLTFYELTTDLKVINSFESFQSKYLEKRRTHLHTSQDCNFSIAKDTLYAAKCLCFVTSEPIFQCLRAYLEQLYAVTVNRTTSELPVECYLHNLLYEVTLSAPGKSLRFMGELSCWAASLY